MPEVGSLRNIAGICDKDKKVFGMMPHPERNNYDLKDAWGSESFYSMVAAYVKQSQADIEKLIMERP